MPVVYVMDNHEYYDARYETVLRGSREEAKQLDVFLLENDAVEIGGVRFLGCTLWTDFDIE